MAGGTARQTVGRSPSQRNHVQRDLNAAPSDGKRLASRTCPPAASSKADPWTKISHTPWVWGALAGGVGGLTLLILVGIWCCRRQRGPSRQWAHHVLDRWHSNRSSSLSHPSATRSMAQASAPPPVDEVKSGVGASFAAVGAMPAVFVPPTYILPNAQPVQSATAPSTIATQPDALYPRPGGPVPTEVGSSVVSGQRLWPRSEKKARSDAKSESSRGQVSRGDLPPTVHGSEGGSSYHTETPLSRSGFAFSAANGSVAKTTSSRGFRSQSKIRSLGGSSYQGPSNGPWEPSDSGVEISSNYNQRSHDGVSDAPSRTGTGFSQSAAPSAGRSRLRQMMRISENSRNG